MPARAAPQAADRIFVPAAGSAVAGPTVRLAWLEVAGAGFASVDAAVLVQVPGPRIAIVGVFDATIPGATSLLRLRADLAGVLDFPAEGATVNASLHDSGALGIFTVYGDLAFVTSWGATPYVILSLGGFYPGFRPEPAQIRPLSRLGMALDSPLPGLRLRAEGYLAATSNTLQLDVGFDAGIDSVNGFLGVDAIIQFTPFAFRAQTASGLDVRFLGETFCGVRFDGEIAGPGPVTLHGKITVETFIKDFDWEDTSRLRPPRRAAWHSAKAGHRAAAGRGVQALDGAGAWQRGRLGCAQRAGSAAGARRGRAARRPHLGTAPGAVRAGARPGRRHALGFGAAGGGKHSGLDRSRDGALRARSYLTLTQAQALAMPSYDVLPAGVSAGAGRSVDGAAKPADNTPQALRKALRFVSVGLLAGFPGGLFAMVQDRYRPAAVADQGVRVTVAATPWVTTLDGAAHGSATQAIRTAVLAGGAAVTAADHAAPVAVQGI